MNKVQTKKFVSVVESLDSAHLAILATAVDPDAVASSLALKFLMEKLNPMLKISIFYGGEIGHPQSRAMFTRYSLNEHVHPDLEFNHSSFDHLALVDSSKVDDPRFRGMNEVKPIIVIDHHSESTVEDTDGNFIWIEPVGATATLITELAVSLKDKIEFRSYGDARLGYLFRHESFQQS
jgi:nanoRNase/pAp phosphatase (c-di-AMP/oligoRNAs hydrolase)